MQQKISSGDKDFDSVFKDMIKISSYMFLRVYRENADTAEAKRFLTAHYPNPDPPQDQPDPRFDNKLNDLKEGFLDDIFDMQSNLNRAEFITNVSEKAIWVFESEEIRKKWDELCKP